MAVPDQWHAPLPGLPGVRTALAWQRSLLLVAATGAALVKLAVDGHQAVFGVVAGTVLVLVTVALYLRTARGQVVMPGWGDHRRRAVQALTAIAVLAAVLSLVTIVLAG